MSTPMLMLKELGTIHTGSTPSTNDESLFGGDIPFVTPSDLDAVSPIQTTPRTLTEAGVKTADLLPAESVLVSCIGSLGKIGFAGRPVVTNQQINAVVFNPAKVHPRYGFFACRMLKPQLELMAPATTVRIVNKSRFSELRIRVPALEEQRRIAAILDQAETLRTQRRQALAHLDTLTQAIFLDMFGDPVANQKGFETCLLGDIIEFVGGSQPAKEHFTFEPSPDSIRLVQIRDFRTDEFKTYIPRKLAKRLFEVDDVMIGRYGPPVFQIFRGLSGSYNVALMKALPKAGVLRDFIFFLLQEPGLHGYVVDRSTRTAGQSGVNLELLENYPAFKPPVALQQTFATRIQAIESLKVTHRAALAQLDALFASLQQRAFAGAL